MFQNIGTVHCKKCRLLVMIFPMWSINSYYSDQAECSLFLAPSTIPGAGRGVFAGKSFEYLEVLETVSILQFLRMDCESFSLYNYAYSTDNEQYDMIMFGAGLLYNHNEIKSVEYNWANSTVTNCVYCGSVEFSAAMPISTGQEIFVDYGEDWLSSRLLGPPLEFRESTNKTTISIHNEVSVESVSLQELQQYGHCLTHVEVRRSKIPNAGQGLFAKKAYVKGEVVSIAPVLTLPRPLVEDSMRSSVLMNYCIAAPSRRSDVTLFPLNNAVLVNHQPADLANLDMQWYDWSAVPSTGSYFEHLDKNALNLSAKLALSPEELFSASFAPLDIAYVASRDIGEGEELTYDYGDDWAAEWQKFQNELNVWEKEEGAWVAAGECNSVNCQQLTRRLAPQFRSFIHTPVNLFPSHWLDTMPQQQFINE